MDAVVYKGFRFHSCVHTNHERITMARLSGERSPSRGTTSRLLLFAIELSGAERSLTHASARPVPIPADSRLTRILIAHRRFRRGSLSVEASRECVRSVVSRSVVSRRARRVTRRVVTFGVVLDRYENVRRYTTRV